MKNKARPETFPLVPPPGETRRETVGERRSAAHRSDPAQRWQGQPGEHDNRPDVAISGVPQRLRARQTEARTADQCHVRTRRRAAEVI